MINASLGKYHHSESLIHHLDPRTKILSLISILVSISIANSAYGFIIISIFIALEITISHIPLRLIAQYIRPMLWLFISIILLHALFTDADTEIIFSAGPVKVTLRGLYDGFLICYRFLLAVLCTAILMLTTMPIRLADGIAEFLKPFRRIKVPVDQIPVMMMVTLRFIPTLFSEGEKLILSQKVRGLKFENQGFLRKLFFISALIAPLMRNSFRMADELAMSVESRCYHGGTRTHLYELIFHKADYMTIFISISMIPLTLALNYLNWL